MPGLKEPIKITTQKLNDTVIEAIKSDLNDHNWSELRELDTNEVFNQFHNTLLSSIENRAPIKTKTILKGKTNEPWLNASILKCIKKQKIPDKATLKKDCIECDREKYKNFRSCLTKLKRYCKLDYYKTKCIEFKSNTQKLWRLVNIALKKTKDKTCIIDCIQTGNIKHYESDAIAESLAVYFATVGKEYKNNIPKPQMDTTSYNKKIPNCPTSMYMRPTDLNEVSNLIKSLVGKLSSGHDNVSNKLL